MNNSGRITYYGRLASASDASNASVSFDPAGKWDPEQGDRLYVFNEQFNGEKKTDYASELAEIEEAAIDDDGIWIGSGTENDPYVIGAMGWRSLAEFTASGNSTENMHFKLKSSFRTSEMIGTKDHPFRGVIDGDGHTITFIKTAEGEVCAPFAYTKNASFMNLRTEGKIVTQYKFAAGLAARASGVTSVTNCRSSIDIESNVTDDGTHGGFIASGDDVIFEGCAFDGKIIGENTTLCAGFLGWDSSKGSSDCINCVFDAEAVETAGSTANFIRNTDKANNCYYTKAIGQDRDRGKAAFSVTADPGITMSFGEGTEYSVSGITVDDTGIRYDGVFYAAKDEQVSLTMDDPSDDDKKYIVNYGTIIGSGTQYKIVMPDRNVIVSTIPTKLSTPENLSMVRWKEVL